MQDRLITLKELEEICGRKTSTIYDAIKEGTLPPPHPNFKGRWLLSQVMHALRTPAETDAFPLLPLDQLAPTNKAGASRAV